MRTARVARLLSLIRALESSRPRTADDLAKLLGISRRTVFRDLRLLAQAGVPTSFDRATRRYTAEKSMLLPPVALTHAEALALMLATRYAAPQFAPDQAAAKAAAMKIESALPAAIRDYCGSLAERIEIRPGPISDTASIAGAFTTLQSALSEQTLLQARYDAYYEGQVLDLVLHPYYLAHVHRGWYLIAYSEHHGATRTFKVERFLQIKKLAEKFTLDRRFSLDDYLGCAWNMIRGDRRYHVKIRFLKQVAANVDEIAWHKTQRAVYQDDGSLLFEVDVDGVSEIAWWVLGYGEQAQVLEPPELRKIVAGHVERMSLFYGVNGHRGADRSSPARHK